MYFLWRNKWNPESHNFRILRSYWYFLLKENENVKTDIDIFLLLCLNFWYERNDNFFFSHENYLQKQPFADVLSKNLFLKISQYSQENTWRLEDLQNWCFSCDYLAVFKDFFTVHLGWLVLYTEWMFDAPLNQSIFCTTRNIFNQFNMDLYATGTIFWKHVILFCATLNIFRQHESSFGCHIIFFVATTYFFVAP